MVMKKLSCKMIDARGRSSGYNPLTLFYPRGDF